MQLIHLTDLHYRHDQPFQKQLIRALLDDLSQKISEGSAPDAIIFSGDLVNNPDEPDIFKHFNESFFQPLLSIVRLSPKDAIFCPGNHDVSQRALAEWKDERGKVVALLSGNTDALDKYLKTGPALAYIKAISSGFYDLMTSIGNPWSDQPLHHAYHFPTQKMSFVALSTAFGCGLEGSTYDRGKLAVPGEQTLAAFQSVPETHRTFSLMHHTFADLSENSSRVALPIIEKNSEAHFFGHIHLAKPSAVKAPSSSCFTVQGGALYERKDNFNSYSIIDIGPEPDHIAAHYRTYFPARTSFDTGINVVKGGTFYSSEASKSYWDHLIPTADNDDICLWLLDTQADVVKELDKTITPRSLCETFVDPVITRTADDGSMGQSKVTTDQILQSANNLVIACETEYGGTSLLHYLAMTFHSNCVSLTKAMVPSVIDARNIKGAYPAILESTLRSGLPDTTDARFKLQPLHDNGRLVLLIDNLDPSNKLHLDFLAATRTRYKKARLIIAVKLPFVDTQKLRPVLGIEQFDFCQLKTLTRGKVRTLVEKWKLPTRYRTDTVVEEINSRFGALGIPQTPAYVVIYLSVLEDVDGFNPINSSTVIEQFVESALQKYKPVYVFRSAFDYRNQIDYLGAIAERMCRKNSFLIEYSELYDWTKEYFEHIGQEHDLSKLISHFVQNKVFSHEGNSVYFRYNIFLSFFIAHQLQQSKSFRDWLLEDHRYTNYISEIDIYCGLSRGDSKMIEFFSDQFQGYTKELEAYVLPLAWADRLEKLTLPIVKKSETEAFTDGIASQLTSGMPAEKRDEAVSNSNQTESVKPHIQRPETIGILPLWLKALRAYTVSLKNLENLSRVDKERHLKKILQGWSSVMLYACIVFKEIIEKRQIDIGPVRFELDVPNDVDAKTLRLLFVQIPVLISDWVRRDLGSQKLALQLKNDGIPETLSDAFLQTCLYSDLKLDEYLGRLRTLKDKAKDARSISFMEFILVKMHSIFLRLGIDHTEQPEFLHIAAELSAEIKGLDGDERAREIERYTTDLRRRGQVQQLRENMS